MPTPEEIQAAEATQAAAAAAAADTDTTDAPTTFKVTVKGEEKEVTLDELTKGYEKSGGADALMREASEARQGIATATRAHDLLVRSRDESLTDADRIKAMSDLAIHLGDDPATVASQAAELAELSAGGAEEADGTAVQPPKRFTMDQLPPEIAQMVEAGHAAQVATRRQEIFDIVEKTVDTDPVLSKLGDSAKAFAKVEARDQVQRRVVALQEDFSSDLVADVLQKLRPVATLVSKGSETGSVADTVKRLAPEAFIEHPELMSLEGADEAMKTYAEALRESDGVTPSEEPRVVELRKRLYGGDLPMSKTGKVIPSFNNKNDWTADFLADVQRKVRLTEATQTQRSALNR